MQKHVRCPLRVEALAVVIRKWLKRWHIGSSVKFAPHLSQYITNIMQCSIYLSNATRKYVGVYCEMRDEHRVGGFFYHQIWYTQAGKQNNDSLRWLHKDSFVIDPHLWYARHRGHTIPRSPRAKRTLLYWRPYGDHFVKFPDFSRNHTTFCLNNKSTLTKKPHLWSPTNNLK